MLFRSIDDVNVVATCCTGVCSNHAFLLFFFLVFVPAKFFFSGRNVWYTPVRPVLSGIGRYLERYILKVFWYRFIDRYEEFRPYRPVRYGINILGGNMSLSLVANWTSLEYIDLSYNLFEGLFSFSLFANHSKLRVIQLFSDNNKLDIKTENPSWDPSFQLKVLVLSNYSLNIPTSNIPKFLFNQQELEVVDISHNKLNRSFPIWLLENNTRLQLLNLQSNSFAGQFHLPS